MNTDKIFPDFCRCVINTEIFKRKLSKIILDKNETDKSKIDMINLLYVEYFAKDTPTLATLEDYPFLKERYNDLIALEKSMFPEDRHKIIQVVQNNKEKICRPLHTVADILEKDNLDDKGKIDAIIKAYRTFI